MNTKDLSRDLTIDNIDFKVLSKNCRTQDDLSSLTKHFMKNMIENILKAELEDHIELNSELSKNGYYKKSVRSDTGKLELDIPRDRNSDYKPQLIPKGKTTISGIDDKIISMYAGMSLRDIEKQVKEMYDVDMSDSLISRIVDKITPEISQWQNRTLEPIYPIVYMDAMVFKVKDDITDYINFYNNKRFHQSLDYKKPMDVYYDSIHTNIKKAELEDQNAA